KAAVRSSGAELGSQVKRIVISGLDANTDWSLALEDIVAVIHSAARVHVMNDQTPDPLAEFRKVNVEGTLHLARQAALAGVKRFIFLSSIKVNGEGTRPGVPYTAFVATEPQDSYGGSDREAVEGLRRLAHVTGIEMVVIRPVLVYGLCLTADLRSMIIRVNRGIPLPLRDIHNHRSL